MSVLFTGSLFILSSKFMNVLIKIKILNNYIINFIIKLLYNIQFNKYWLIYLKK